MRGRDPSQGWKDGTFWWLTRLRGGTKRLCLTACLNFWLAKVSVPVAAVTVAVLQTSRLQLQFLELSTCAQDQQLPMKFPNLHHQTGTTEVEHRTPTSFSACPGCRWPLDDLPSIMQAILVFLIHVNTHIHVIFLYRICLLYKH